MHQHFYEAWAWTSCRPLVALSMKQSCDAHMSRGEERSSGVLWRSWIISWGLSAFLCLFIHSTLHSSIFWASIVYSVVVVVVRLFLAGELWCLAGTMDHECCMMLMRCFYLSFILPIGLSSCSGDLVSRSLVELLMLGMYKKRAFPFLLHFSPHIGEFEVHWLP